MKKLVVCILIIVMLFSVALQNNVYATNSASFNSINNGTSVRNEKEGSLELASNWDVTGSILSSIVLIVPLTVTCLLTLGSLSTAKVTEIKWFNIEDLLMGEYDLFNINFLKVDNTIDSGNIAIDRLTSISTNTLIKQNVAQWFYALRNFSIIALLAVLIYIGILMAISSVADDKAKYKKMLINWFASFVLLMLLPYIMSLAINTSEFLVKTVGNGTKSIISATSGSKDGKLGFEETLVYGSVDSEGNEFEGILSKIISSSGWEAMALVFVYCVIAYYQFKFFMMYLKRLFTVGFLIVISPLITITYSIDKAGDNQAQAYKTWIKEFLVNVFIQPLHLLLFVVFACATMNIIKIAPLLAVVLLGALSRGELLVRKIFKIERTVGMGRLGKGHGK